MSKFDRLLKYTLGRLFHLSITFVEVFLLVILLSTGAAYSAQATLAWDSNTEKDLAGYKIYYGTSSGNYDASVDVGNWTSCTIAELEEGQTYYFSATAYDFDGNESDFSNEVTWTNDAVSDSILLRANFDNDDEGFTYVDDPFRHTSEPSYAHGVQVASGGFKGGALQVTLGGINNADILGMSGGWEQSFTVNDITDDITISFLYTLTQTSDYESDEYSQVLVSVDGTLFGQGSKDYVAQIAGNGNGGNLETTGWKSFEVNLGTLTVGNYTLAIGGYNNKKTYNNESTEVLIDEVRVVGMTSGSDTDPPSPNPMTWATVPYATGSNSISMTAATASDPCGVEYYFNCNSAGCNDSGWQDSPTYTDMGLQPDTEYSYICKARDKCPNQNETTFSIEQSAIIPDEGGVQATVGNEKVFASTSVRSNRRSMPFTMPEDGTIESITIYHEGGSGDVILALYDGETLPDNRLAVTAQTAVEDSAGWQMIGLTNPVFVPEGTRIWLAWVFEDKPRIRYKAGTPGRAHSSQTWSGGMPDPFGASKQGNYVYSIYATYTTGGAP